MSNDYGASSAPPLFLINGMSGSQYCHYGFQIDTYKDGCTNDCTYCYAREEGLREGHWNMPLPNPIDIGVVREIFSTVLETDKPSPWRNIIGRRVPLRLGGYTDCFMRMEKHHGVTLELLRILKKYRYPTVIVTRSDMIADDEYLAEMDPELTVPQISLVSLDEKLTKVIEPRASAPEKRLRFIKKLAAAGFRVAIRINPLFPIYPDGYYSKPGFDRDGSPALGFFSFDLIERAAEAGVKTVIAGFVHLPPHQLTEIQTNLAPLGVDLHQFMEPELRDGSKGFRYSAPEIRAYYEIMKQRCDARGIDFTTCYLGMGDSDYETHRDLWAVRGDCCAIKGCLTAFDKTAVDVSMSDLINANRAGSSWFARSTELVTLKMLKFMANSLKPTNP